MFRLIVLMSVDYWAKPTPLVQKMLVGTFGEGCDLRAWRAMTVPEIPIHQIQKYLQQLTSQARRRLLVEMERLQVCDDDMPGSDIILAELRSEFGKKGQALVQIGNPSSYFFQPLEPLLVDRAPERTNAGQISRGSLSAIWEWISQNLLPTMARNYADKIKQMIAANQLHEIPQVAVTFQTKIAKYLESTLAGNGGAVRVRADLAMYTSSRAVFDDLTKILCALRARDALTQFNKALPHTIGNFEADQLATVRRLLDAFTAEHAEAMPFALTIVANHLKTQWQLLRLATKTSKSKNTADAAATPYVIAVSMVLNELDDKRLALRRALKSNRILVAKDLISEIYDIEHALRSRVDLLDEFHSSQQLDDLMEAVAALVEAEIQSLPGNIRHVLGARSLRNRGSLMGRLTSFASKGREALTGGAAYCKKLISQTDKSPD